MTDSLTIDLLEAVQAWGLGGGGDDDHDELLHAFTVWFDAGGSVSQVEQLLTIGQAVMDAENKGYDKFCAGVAMSVTINGGTIITARAESVIDFLNSRGRAVGAVTDIPPDAARRGSVQEGKT